ncbi:MAG: methyltransferase domain-containing protein [Myxococcota bacterium]
MPIENRLTAGAARLLLVLLLVLPAGCTDLKRWAYEDFGDRDEWQDPARVVESLALAPGSQVADLGSGGGYFTFRLADAVGPEGRVYAIDVDEGMNDYVRDTAEADGYANVETVLAIGDDPLFPEPVDLLFTCNTYHHLENRTDYFAGLQDSLRSGGRIAIIDYSGEGGFFERRHSTPPDVIQTEMEAAGYRLDASHEFLTRQSFQVFTLASDEG